MNEDILETLGDTSTPNFWWLNNGVTILATSAVPLGGALHLEDIQIVNGLQTTESIYKYFSSKPLESDDRAILVRAIVSDDTKIRDRIIRATNNQTPVEVSALRATDKVQRDIDEILEKYGWFYERRKNYYRNIGKPAVRFVTPLYLAGGYVGLIKKNPSAAARI